MASRADTGELRTLIQILRVPKGQDGQPLRDEDGYPVEETVNLFGEGKHLHCKWVNAHGSEVYEAKVASVTEPATLTIRYVPGVTTDCLVLRRGETRPYEVISVNDVEDRHIWLELKVQRKGAVA